MIEAHFFRKTLGLSITKKQKNNREIDFINY